MSMAFLGMKRNEKNFPLKSDPLKEVREVLVDEFRFDDFRVGYIEQLESDESVSSIEVDGGSQTVRVFEYAVV